MTTTAAPGTPARTPAPSAGAESRPSGFRTAVVLAVLLTVPAVYLVARGELSAHDALVRFGCAWAFAAGGVALVLSTVGGSGAEPVTAARPTEPGESAADVPDGADAAHPDDGAGTPLG